MTETRAVWVQAVLVMCNLHIIMVDRRVEPNRNDSPSIVFR